MATNEREIERKYLLRALPAEAAGAPVVEMDQGYLPGERILERIRRVTAADGVRYYRTVKVGVGIERLEFEEETTELFFTTVWPLTRGRRVHKRRYVVPAGGMAWEIDEFLDRTLVLAELELERADQAVEIPGWLRAALDREVTEEKGFSNFELAR
ncbi:MAG: domain containing protein [Gemmatimonadetes bacterium]|nr:domain containing protein [Gemmatimonadota bacterium]